MVQSFHEMQELNVADLQWRDRLEAGKKGQRKEMYDDELSSGRERLTYCGRKTCVRKAFNTGSGICSSLRLLYIQGPDPKYRPTPRSGPSRCYRVGTGIIILKKKVVRLEKVLCRICLCILDY